MYIVPPELEAKIDQFWLKFHTKHQTHAIGTPSFRVLAFWNRDFDSEDREQWDAIQQEILLAQPLEVQLEAKKRREEDRIKITRLNRMDTFREILQQTDSAAPPYGDVFLARFEDWDRSST